MTEFDTSSSELSMLSHAARMPAQSIWPV
ncbi:hypothetical protein R2601_03913 [Salipiger bermudensis HTCC2601]|uniref:Uncharacterized protein n=1 Tax=Salipiger bermudensis (strain DSM 26914 / JCM 13377 / KCTC 12554 / HTCC2601) TaxID=314265 RepID=Q0FW63_SALBH|nr:hypothetical protein R2601_03913 [Salipiger bermudensis HTCC2601]